MSDSGTPSAFDQAVLAVAAVVDELELTDSEELALWEQLGFYALDVAVGGNR